MPPFQTNSNVMVAIKRETTAGTPAGTTGGEIMRIVDSPGMELTRSVIQSNEKRADGLKPMGRLGSKTNDGSYNFELTVGGATDIAFEAIMRGVWTAAMTTTATGAGAFVNLQASSTSVLTRTGTGSFITDGYKVGDVIRTTNLTNAVNKGQTSRVTAVTALTMTLAGAPLIADAVSTTATITRLKKLVNPAAPVVYNHTIEENDTIADLSSIHVGAQLVGMSISFKPNSMATYQLTFKALDRLALVPGTSPYFTTPALSTSMALVADDSVIRYNGVDVAYMTGFDINFNIDAEGVATIGSVVSAGIAQSDLTVDGQITMLMQDYSNVTMFDAETEFSASILLAEPTGTPKACVCIYLPRIKLSKRSAPVGGGSGFKVETLGLMTGPKVADATNDAGVAVIYSSAA